MESHSLTSLTNLSVTARRQSLSKKPCVTWETDCCLTNSVHSWACPHGLEEEGNLVKSICHLSVQKFPFNSEGILKLCTFPPMKGVLVMGVFYGK